MFNRFFGTPKKTEALSKVVQECVAVNVPYFSQVTKFYDANVNIKTIVDVAKTGFTLTIEPPKASDYICLVSSCFNGSASCVVHRCKTEEELKLIFHDSTLSVFWWDYTIKPLIEPQGFTKINEGEYELTLGNGTTVKAMPTFGTGSACFLKHAANDLLPVDIDDLLLMIAKFKDVCAGS